MAMFNVWLNGRKIDAVHYQLNPRETIPSAVENVRKSMVDRDGLSPDIRVTWPKGQRVTMDSFDLEGDYGQGWEVLCSEETRKAARQRKREYMENAPCPLRIVKRRSRA